MSRRNTRSAITAPRGSAPRAQHDSRPIWMAVLAASGCHAATGGREHAIAWEWVAGRAVYANITADTEVIQPLGVHLPGGHILAVHWLPGETAYSLETYRHHFEDRLRESELGRVA